MGIESMNTEGAKGAMPLEVLDETRSEGSKQLIIRILGVAIKGQEIDESYIPYKTRKVTKALTGNLMQTRNQFMKRLKLKLKWWI